MNTKKDYFFPVTFLAIFNIFWFISQYCCGIIMGLDTNSSVSKATAYELRNEESGFGSQQEQEIVLFFTGSTPRLRPT
jgi:hypothetical protein